MADRILLLLSNKSNRSVLKDWIQNQTDYTVSPHSDPQNRNFEETDPVFDLCILNKKSFDENRSWLIKTKEEERPVILPYLFILPESEEANLSRKLPTSSEKVLRKSVDEIIKTPLSKRELELRIDSLLRMREQSREVKKKERYRKISERLREREEALEVIRDVNRVLIKETDRQELVSSIAERIWESDRFGCTFVTLTKGRTKTYVCEAHSDLTKERASEFHSKEYLQEVFEKDVVVIDDVTSPPYEQHFTEMPEHGAVALALRHNGHKYGVFTVHFPPDSPATQLDIDLLNELADDLAFSLDSIRERELRRDSEKHIQVLDRVLRHNMHNKINVILGYAGILEDQLSGTEEEKIDKIIQNSEELVRTTDKEREIVDVISGDPELETVQIDEITQNVVEKLGDRYHDVSIRYECEEAKTVALPGIRDAVKEVVDNAVTHSEDSTKSFNPEVKVRVETNEMVEIRVVDSNPRIPEEEVGILTGEKEIDPLYHGSGLGLWLVNWIVEKSNGELEFEENDPRGNIVKIRLPNADDSRFWLG